MLYNLIEQADIISIDGMMLLHATLHPKNGLEGTAHSNTDNGATHEYKLSIQELQSAMLKDDCWHVGYMHNNECIIAKVQCFTKHLMKPEMMRE